MSRNALSLAIVTALFATAAAAQVPIRPPTPSILAWTPQQQSEGYRAIETIYKVTTVKRGRKVHALPNADRQIDFSFEYDGRTWSVDDYMTAYNVSGVLVLKDGKVLMPEQVSVGKLNNVREAIAIAQAAREVLAGDGVTSEFPVMRHLANLEAVRTYEGTDDIHALVIGRALTGISAF